MTWIAYHISPIDFGWETLPTVAEAAAKIASSEADQIMGAVDDDLPGSEVVQFLKDFDAARGLAQAKGWEGDYRRGHEPRVCWLPAEATFAYAFVWKQENNGSTFVVSPHKLPWLDDVAV